MKVIFKLKNILGAVVLDLISETDTEEDVSGERGLLIVAHCESTILLSLNDLINLAVFEGVATGVVVLSHNPALHMLVHRPGHT